MEGALNFGDEKLAMALAAAKVDSEKDNLAHKETIVSIIILHMPCFTLIVTCNP